MSLFGKTEIDPEIIPFIERGEGVGVVKVEAYGKASARMESYKIIFNSYGDKNPIIESVSAINYLSYNKGNFFKEPKLEIGISHKKYILTGVDNNDEELESFYKTLLNIKNLEKEQKLSSHGFSRPAVNYDLEEEIVDLDEDLKLIDENDVSEDEIENHDDELDEVEEKTELNETDIEDLSEIEDGISEEKPVGPIDSFEEDDDFEVLEEELIEEDREIIEDKTENIDESIESESEEDGDLDDVIEELEVTEEESMDVEDTVDEKISDDKSEVDNIEIDEDTSEMDEIIEFEDELEEIVDEETDLDRVINDSDDEIIIEEDILDKIDETSAEESINISVPEEKAVESVSDTAPDINLHEKVTKDNASEQLGQMKQQLYQGLNTIQAELNVENKTNPQYIPTYRQLDPVDQIRRYYELKEDGIITEEEFEQKKKQLLEI